MERIKKRKKRKAEKLAYKVTRGGGAIRRQVFRLVLRVMFSCEIPSSVKLGDNVELVHNGLGVVMHNNTVIGNNCKIYQNVTLGGNGKIIGGKTTLGGPTIEDDCAIFCGACVLGPITIGRGTYVGANAVVTRDVPPNSLVYGNPMVITDRKYDIDFGD